MGQTIVDIPLTWTATKSPAKITDIWLKQIPTITDYLSLLRTYGHLSRSQQLNVIVLTLVVMDVNQHLLTFRQNYLKLQFISSSFSLRLCIFGWTLWALYQETTVLTCKKQSWYTYVHKVDFLVHFSMYNTKNIIPLISRFVFPQPIFYLFFSLRFILLELTLKVRK